MTYQSCELPPETSNSNEYSFGSRAQDLHIAFPTRKAYFLKIKNKRNSFTREYKFAYVWIVITIFGLTILYMSHNRSK
jgi:hypothetical protein